MQELIVNLSITSEQYKTVYQGYSQQIIGSTNDGTTVAFPAHRLRPFITHLGINGQFKIIFDEDNKIIAIHKI